MAKKILCVLFVSVFMSFTVLAVRAPEHYRSEIMSSKIKAVAVIESVETVEKNRKWSRKKVVFSLVKAFESSVRKKFSGYCYSVDSEKQEPGEGGNLFFYPVEGEKVLVTVKKNGSEITSLTFLTKKLEKKLNSHGLSGVKFVMGKAVPNDLDER